MADLPKPWKIEYAKSSRSSCKSCKKTIDKDELRLGKMVAATQFDGFMPMWNHADCIFKKGNQIKSFDDVEGTDLLRWEDQQKIQKYVEGVALSDGAANEGTIEVSQTSRAVCRYCNKKITKGKVRASTKPDVPGAKGLAWHHINCFIEMSPSVHIEKLSGWDSLLIQDKEAICAAAKRDSATTKKASKVDGNDAHKKLLEKSSKGIKRKKSMTIEPKKKIKKSEGNELATTVSAKLESVLEVQTKALWAIKDDLQKHLTTAELCEMLEVNGQDSTGPDHALRDRCADGMLFGALDCCPICSGPLHYSGVQYRCHGNVSAWRKCSYFTTEPVRLKGKWKIPGETSNQYLCKWFKSQKGKKADRVLPPRSTYKSPGGEVANPSQSYKGEKLEELRFAFVGILNELAEEWKNKIEEAGGTVHAKIMKDTTCLVVSGELDEHEPEIRKARRMKIAIVREDYLVDCIKKKRRLPFEQYKIEAVGEALGNGMVTVNVKGRSAMHEASGLQSTGHVLEDGKSIYNTTLNMSDLSTGINRYNTRRRLKQYATERSQPSHHVVELPVPSQQGQTSQPSDQVTKQAQLSQQPLHLDTSMPDHEPSSSQPSGFKVAPRRTRGPTRSLSILNRAPGSKVKVDFGPENQPIGQNASKFTNFLAGLAKNGDLLAINVDDWRAIEDPAKEKVWDIVRDTFDIPEYTKAWVLSNTGRHWRDWKYRLKTKFYTSYQTYDERLAACIDPRVKSDQWEALVNYWDSPEGMARSVTNTANRSKQKFTHTGGSKSFSRIREELRRVDGSDPSRSHMFIATHSNKSGEPMDEVVAAIFAQFQERASQLPEDVVDNVARDDIFSQVMGEERRGYIRTYGFGPSPSRIWGATPSRTEALRLATQSNKEVQHLRREMQEIRAMMQDMQMRVAVLQSGFQGGGGPSVPAKEASDVGSGQRVSERVQSSGGSRAVPDPDIQQD